MKLKVFTMPAALLLLLCTGCGGRGGDPRIAGLHKEAEAGNQVYAADSTQMATDKEYFQDPGGKDKPADKGGHNSNGGPTADANPDWDKKIIKTADLSIQVRDLRAFASRLHATVKQSGGYLSKEEQTTNEGISENDVTIRIPVDRFEDFIVQLPADSDKLMEKKITSEDVTGEVVDTRSRLETKKGVRERYLELLKRADKMEDIIAVQNEIDGIQEEMDRASARIAYLGHSAAYSTVNLKFYQVLDESVQEKKEPTFVHRLVNAIREGWNGFSEFLIAFVSAWPVWLILFLIVYGIGKWARRLRLKAHAVSVARPREEPAK
jgi:hypothetical protein